MDDSLHTDGGGDVGLAGAGTTIENDVPGVVEDLATVQGLHPARANADFGKVKAGEIPLREKARNLHLIAGGTHLAFRELGLTLSINADLTQGIVEGKRH